MSARQKIALSDSKFTRIPDARKLLEQWVAAGQMPSIIDRPHVVAYATLAAFTQHFPALAFARDEELLQIALPIRTLEADRYFKQRRIALDQLCEEYHRDIRSS